MQNSFLNVLRYPDFKKIWLSQVFSQIALNIVTFALVLHIYDITGRAYAISLVMIASAIPIALFGPFSGVVAEKFNFRKILIYTNILRFVAALLLIPASRDVLAMLEIILIISGLSQIFTPAESSSIPSLVPKNKLMEANSCVLTTTYVTLLLGYSMAGPILKYLGNFWLFVICAILFLIAAWATYALSQYDKKEHSLPSLVNLASSISHVWHDSLEGLRYFRGKTSLTKPMMKLTIGWVILGAFITLLPAFSETVLEMNPKLIGTFIIAPAGFGMVMSLVFMNKRHLVPNEKTINRGFFIFGLALLFLSLYRFYSFLSLRIFILMILIIFMGYGSGYIQVTAQTLLHLNSEENKRGRVFGFSSMQLRLATTLPALFVGGMADLTSPMITMIILALLVFIYAMILVFE